MSKFLKASEILERARDKYLWSGHGVRYTHFRERYICHAVAAVEYSGKRKLKGDFEKVYGRIDELLAPAVSYEGWMLRNHAAVYDKMAVAGRTEEFLATVQEARLRWINDMIAYFKARGE